MLKLALCDDDALLRAGVEAQLREYLRLRPELTAKLSVFSSGRELLSAAEEQGPFHLYILDVVMPDISGIELGLKLRKLNPNDLIIYLTVSSEYAIDSYDVHAFHYLLKPVQSQRLYEVLDQAVALLEKRRSACVAVKTRNELQILSLDDILFAELSQRRVCYHLENGDTVESVTMRGSFQDEIAPLLSDPRFFLSSVSFVVNLYYVTSVDKGALHLKGGLRVPLARRLLTQARQRWSDYWLDTAEEDL